MSNPNERATIARTMHAVAADCQTDALSLDGQRFTGPNVAAVFGTTLAMLATVAEAVAQLAEEGIEL